MQAATAPSALFDPPVVEIQIAGRALLPAEQSALTAVEVAQRVDRPAVCIVTFLAARLPALDALTADGAKLALRVRGHDVALFEGVVTGSERSWHSDRAEQLTVRAEDRLAELRHLSRVASYEGTTVVAVVTEVIGRYALGVQAVATSPPVDALHQSGEHDLAFVRRLVAPLGLHFTLRGGTVHLYDDQGIGDPLDLEIGRELLDLAVARTPHPAAERGVLGWDSATCRPFAIGGERTTAQVYSTEAEARRSLLAAAADDDARRHSVSGTALGDTGLRPGTRVRCRHHGRDVLDQPLTLTTTRHRIDSARGYTVEFDTAPPEPPATTTAATCTLGIVEDVGDPERRGRVRVGLPAVSGRPTWWMPVVLAALGTGKGVVALPDVGDTVVVIGPQHAPERGVVLGGVCVDAPIAGDPITAAAVGRLHIGLPGGSRVVLDDASSTVELHDRTGSRLHMSPDRVLLHAATDLVIQAPGRHLRVVADQIDFERG
jgi:phage protein D/phage baseplate assembly protein gpV